MPWPEDRTPPPERRDQLAALFTRAIIAAVAILILGNCAQSWFPASAVDQGAMEEHAAVGTGDADR